MKKARYLINQPDHYMADPSAHVFNGKIYIYPSHDVEAGIPENDNGDHFDMRDYHVFSMEDIDGEVIDHGVVLSVKDIPWAGRQLWDSDVAEKDGKYYLYFSLKDKNDVFHIGVATSHRPEGPFVPESNHIPGSYSGCLPFLPQHFGGLREPWNSRCNTSPHRDLLHVQTGTPT